MANHTAHTGHRARQTVRRPIIWLCLGLMNAQPPIQSNEDATGVNDILME